MKKRVLSLIITIGVLFTFIPVISANTENIVAVTTYAELQTAVNNFVNATADTTILIGADITYDAYLGWSNSYSHNHTLTIKSAPGATRKLIRGDNYGNYFLYLGNNSHFILENIIIDGNKDNVMGGLGSSPIQIRGADAMLTINDGVIIENFNESFRTAGMIRVGSGGTVVMNGGIIRNNNGGAVMCDASSTTTIGTFIMNGGEIRDNEVLWGYLITNAGAFIMNDGKIINNNVHYGGSGNKGGAIYTGPGHSTVADIVRFEMYGGEISGNKGDLGALEFGPPYSNVSLPSLNVIFGGTAKITGNTTFDGIERNVYVTRRSYITIAEGANAPREGMKIGVNKEYTNTYTGVMADDGVFVQSGASVSDLQYFYADEATKMVINEGETLKLVDNNCENHEPPTGFAAPKCHESAKNYNCKNCGAIQTVQPSAHDFGRWVERLPATDLYPAVEELMCNNTACDESSGIFKGRGDGKTNIVADIIINFGDTTIIRLENGKIMTIGEGEGFDITPQQFAAGVSVKITQIIEPTSDVNEFFSALNLAR